MGQFKGKHRLVRILFSRSIRYQRDINLTANDGTRYVLPNISETVGFELFADGVYEKTTIELIKKQLKTDSTWIDIGANIGSVCIPVCRAFPKSNVICIEASPRMFSYLKKNMELNEIQNAKLIQKAISDKDASDVPFFSPDEKYGKGSLSNHYSGKEDLIECIRLDHLIENLGRPEISFIKIDVEGFEYAVFSGAKKLLVDDNAPDILFEFMDWAEKAVPGRREGDAQRLLIEYGYTIYEFDQSGKCFPLKDIVTHDYRVLYASKKRMEQ